MTKVVHDTDIGANLEIAGGKLKAAETLTTDLELSNAIAANNATDATEERMILDNIRNQDGILFTAPWEIDGYKVKAYTGTAGGYPQFLSTYTKGGLLSFMFPVAGATVRGLGQPDITVDAQGFVTLPTWGVLWYKWAGTDTGWYYSQHTVTFDATVEYIRVMCLGHENGIMGHLADGTIIYQGMNYPQRVTSTSGKYDAPYRRHTRNLGVFEGFIGIVLTSREGDYANATVSADSVLSNTVVHFKLPLKSGTGVSASDTNQMYHLHFTGHTYLATKKVVDFTVVGYAFNTGLHGAEVQGTHAPEVTQYQGSDNHVYARVAFGNGYCHTLSIDSMAVGNGLPLKHGSIQAIINPAATL